MAIQSKMPLIDVAAATFASFNSGKNYVRHRAKFALGNTIDTAFGMRSGRQPDASWEGGRAVTAMLFRGSSIYEFLFQIAEDFATTCNEVAAFGTNEPAIARLARATTAQVPEIARPAA